MLSLLQLRTIQKKDFRPNCGTKTEKTKKMNMEMDYEKTV